MTMRLKPTYQNHVKEWVKGSIILYSILLAIYIVDLIFKILMPQIMDNSSDSGLEFVPQMFVFVSGIAMFKPDFKLALANGISRKTEFTATLLAALTVATAFTVLSYFVGCLYNTINHYSSLFNMIYNDYNFQNQGIYYLTEFILDTLTTLGFFVTGYFIGSLYYRMNKALKIIVSVGVPVLFCIGLPTLAGIFGNGFIIVKLIIMIIEFFKMVLQNPYYSIIAIIVEIIAAGVFAFLLMRRAPIKEQG